MTNERLKVLIEERVRRLRPETARAYRLSIDILRQFLSGPELLRRVASGEPMDVILSAQTLDNAFRPFQTQLQTNVQRSFEWSVPDLPGNLSGRMSFNVLSPHVRQAMMTLDAMIMPKLKQEVREVLRQHLADGIEAGEAPTAVARRLRDIVGLAPNQEQSVRNLQRQLINREYGAAKQRQLLDRRFNLKKLDALPEKERLAQIGKIVGRYRQSFTAFHADTIAKTATLNSYRTGQRLAVEEAFANGAMDRAHTVKTWITVGDSRVRDAHRAINGETVHIDSPFSNGLMQPTEWNCRCALRYSLRKHI